MLEFLTGFAILVGVYSVFTLGLNVHWGYTGLFNIGVAGFFALGAYTASLLVIRPPQSDQVDDYLFAGDLANRLDALPVIGALDLWFVVALAGAALVAAMVALVIGTITIRLRGDYLAIATLGIAESVRLVFLNERWLSNGSKGLYTIPRVFDGIVSPQDYDRVYLVVVLVVFALMFAVVRALVHSPWGRVLRAIREDEVTAEASGKHVFRFKLQAFVLGAVIMGIGGALYAFDLRAISPSAFTPLLGTFIIWAMLVVGGSGRLYSPVVGALIVWGIWSGSQFLPDPLGSPHVRYFSVGALVVLVLMYAPDGITPEVLRIRDRWLARWRPRRVAANE
ncbi:MAG: branched-chain amino acid ABC transporter permease [Chloroflexi bacterium]|nr:branched-chain amino acid ABC transporter permease [Chloroflexota bacterium]MYA50630.1 branched-chain amino acid ABC transporter permease [Chloroflexota bacterium]MYB85175.1 branched-chain amino acid ABC transporter permease [Chloroflexota bacterium]MYK35492.1 branched-chain amino acid ABC transporter permease [Chloroflexota bacterium]